MTFSERPDDKGPLIQYREWVLTQCSGLKKLDRVAVSRSERERIRRAPLEHEPGVDGEGGEGGGAMEAAGSGGGHGGGDEMQTRWEYDGPRRTSLLSVHAELLQECLSLPSSRVNIVLARVQQSLQALLDVPPNCRTLFEQVEDAQEEEEEEEGEGGVLDQLLSGVVEEVADEPPDAARKAALRMRLEGESALKAEARVAKIDGGGRGAEMEEEAPSTPEDAEDSEAAGEDASEAGKRPVVPTVQLDPADVVEQARHLPCPAARPRPLPRPHLRPGPRPCPHQCPRSHLCPHPSPSPSPSR